MSDHPEIDAALLALSQAAEAARAQGNEIAALATIYTETLRGGGTLFFAGNGGSAADAQHLATEYVVRLRTNRKAMAAIALTTDSSLLTAAANDFGFDMIFARQIEALGRPGDLLILHSTSGKSTNLLAAARAARTNGVRIVAFLGQGGGPLATMVDHVFIAPSYDSCHVQELHLAVEHIIAGLVERELS